MCELGEVSRAGLYRRWQRVVVPGATAQEPARVLLRRIARAIPSYGRPRLTRELRRRGWTVNAKRVHRWMRADDLLCPRRRNFQVTTHSAHALPIYPNRARWMHLTGLNQLWVADITYIRLQEEFVYLAVVLDAFSRRVIGWALERTMQDTLTLAALRHALQQRRPAPGLVHHSDRGVQYASRAYTALLAGHGITISMSRSGNPYDNAVAESFMKTFKYEQVYREDYRDLAEARGSIRRFLEQIYNRKRLHSALGYRPPQEFERALQSAATGEMQPAVATVEGAR
jgi:transposase InsO family protein